MSALGFGVGLGFKRVPPALVEVADEHGFPVFAVPYETPFREIIHFVDSSLTSGEEHVFRRLTALQRYLVDALRTPQPERAMVDRLAQLPRRQRGAARRRGRARDRRRQAAGRDELLERGLRAAARAASSSRSSGWHAVATPVVTRADQAERWLVLASPRPGSSPSSPSRPPRRPRRCSPRWRGSATSCATRSRPSRRRCSRRRSSRSRRATCRRSPRARRRSGSTSRSAARGWWSLRLEPAACGASSSPRLEARRASRTSCSGATARSRRWCRAACTTRWPRSPTALPERARSASAGRSPRSSRSHHSLRDAELAVAHAAEPGASCASRTSTSARSWSARSRPSGSARRSTRSSPCCAPTRRCTRRCSAYFAHDLDIAATAAVAAHAPQLAALPARARRAGARPLAQAAVDDRRDLHRARGRRGARP